MHQPVTKKELQEELAEFKKSLEGGVCTCPNMVTKMSNVEQLLTGTNAEIAEVKTMIEVYAKGTNDRLSLLEARVIALEAAKNSEANPALDEIKKLLHGLVGQIK